MVYLGPLVVLPVLIAVVLMAPELLVFVPLEDLDIAEAFAAVLVFWGFWLMLENEESTSPSLDSLWVVTALGIGDRIAGSAAGMGWDGCVVVFRDGANADSGII